jgi:hypothetical protein
MKWNRAVAGALVFLACAGCIRGVPRETPYQAKGPEDRYGFRDVRIGEGTHFITVEGNTVTSRAALEFYFHRRAVELCQGREYAWTSEKVSNTDGFTATSSTSAILNTVVSEQSGTTISRHEVSGTVKCNMQQAAVLPMPPPPPPPNPRRPVVMGPHVIFSAGPRVTIEDGGVRYPLAKEKGSCSGLAIGEGVSFETGSLTQCSSVTFIGEKSGVICTASCD